MDDMARTEYPAMLAALQPGQATQALTDRVKRISRINLEVADWLQERRRVEEQYAQSLRRLAQFKVPNAQSELSIFQAPWNRLLGSTETIAQTHLHLADRIEKDIEHPLRNFANRKDFQNMNTMSNNLVAISRDLEEAQDRADKLSKKGGRANTSKMDAATSKLESASQQWESQAPFIFESLQALDESRINQLRDLLTQYQTHESDQAQRVQENAVETLALMLEIDTEKEIHAFVNKTTAGKARIPPHTRTSTRQSSVTGTTPSTPAPPTPAPPSTAGSNHAPTSAFQASPEDDASEHSSIPQEPKPESKLRRLGTMFGGRRRQSMQAGFGQLAPQKASSNFGRLGTSHSQNSRGVSPRGSATNLQEHHRLSSLAETPDTPKVVESENQPPKPQTPVHDNTNGVSNNGGLLDSLVPATFTSPVNGNRDLDVSDVPPPPGPPPAQKQESQPAAPTIGTKVSGTQDAEGFTVPPPMNDPISEAQKEAQREAGEDPDQLLKVNIQQIPVDEEDPQAKLAALSSVANSLKMGPATRRSGTVRGRRDVRHTVYVPPPSLAESHTESPLGGLTTSPSMPTSLSKSSAVAALTSEASITGASDSQSVRSNNSLGSLAHPKHPDMTAPGLNSSIIETVSAVFEDGAIKSAAISGEIAFVNHPTDGDDGKTHETIRINNFSALERIGPNRIFVQNASPEHHDQFALDVSHLTKTATAFSYKVFAEDESASALGQNAPLLLKLAWKPQGDKLGLLLQYQLNPSSKFTAPVTLRDVVIVATYEGRANGAQTKPLGTHLKDKHLVYWRLGDVTLNNEPHKIVCRIIGADGIEPKPGHIEARWEFTASGDEVVGSGVSISKLAEGKGKGRDASEDDPFADDSTSMPEQRWVDVPVVMKLVSGKYESR